MHKYGMIQSFIFLIVFTLDIYPTGVYNIRGDDNNE